MKRKSISPFFADSHQDSNSANVDSVNGTAFENGVIPSLEDGYSLPADSEITNEKWLAYATLSVTITYLFSLAYIYFFTIFTIDLHIPIFVRILNSAASLHLLMLGGIILSYYLFSQRMLWQDDFCFKEWNPLYIAEAVGLEIGLFIPLAILAISTLKILEIVKKFVGPDFAKYLDTTPYFKEYLLKLDWNSFVLVAFIAIVIAPTIEEIVFRRVIFGFVRLKVGLAAAVIITSALFAGIHMRIVDFPTLFVLGVIWQLLFIFHKSLFPSILYHTFHNSVAMGLLFLIKFFEIPVKL